MSVVDGHVWAIVRGEDGTTVIGPSADGTTHEVWDARDIPTRPLPLGDAVKPPGTSAAAEAPLTATRTRAEETVVLEVSVDVANEAYINIFGSNTSGTLAYVANLFAAMSDLFQRDLNIVVTVHDVVVWTTADPFAGGDLSTQLTSFADNVTYRGGDMNHLLASNPVGSSPGGGIAYVSAACGGYAYAVTNVDGGTTFPVFGYSYDLHVAAHETGHTLGSDHTHCYVPPIDMCANEPGCYSGPIVVQQGETMSYCGAGGIFESFSARVIQRIRGFVDYASCMAAKTPACGDAVVDDGEQCDDGNTTDGDCCSSTCQLEPPGAQTCDDGRYCTVDYACGGGGCLAIPRDCDDANPCTYDYCDELANTCGHAGVSSFTACDDGLYCTVFDHCDGVSACTADPRNCDDGTVCTVDSCDEGAQTCINAVLAPNAGCKHAESSKLLLKDDPGNPNRRVLLWKWLHGDETTPADVGMPDAYSDEGMSLCVYDETDQLVSSPNAAGGYPWKRLGSGYRYSDRAAYNAGMSRALLKYGDAGRAKVLVKAKGTYLTLPTLPRGTATLRLQLRKQSGPACWESTFTPPFEVDLPTELKDSE